MTNIMGITEMQFFTRSKNWNKPSRHSSISHLKNKQTLQMSTNCWQLASNWYRKIDFAYKHHVIYPCSDRGISIYDVMIQRDVSNRDVQMRSVNINLSCIVNGHSLFHFWECSLHQVMTEFSQLSIWRVIKKACSK